MPKIEGIVGKRYLGKLCPRSHEYLNTGKSLRNEGSCVECERMRGRKRKLTNYDAQQRWRDKNPEKIKAYSSKRKEDGYYQAYYKAMTTDSKVKVWLKSVEKRAKDRGLEFDLTVEWILQNLPEVCPVLGIPLILGAGQGVKASPNSPSIDRFDNSMGYTQNNCRVISRRANVLKSNASLAELKQVLSYMNTESHEHK